MAEENEPNLAKRLWIWEFNKEPLTLEAICGQFAKGTVKIDLFESDGTSIANLVDNKDASSVKLKLVSDGPGQGAQEDPNEPGLWRVKGDLTDKYLVIACTATDTAAGDTLSLRVLTRDGDDGASKVKDVILFDLDDGGSGTLIATVILAGQS